jgi:hypothetical protein
MGGRDLSWLIRNERSYGLERTVPKEDWHFQNTRTPTRRIIPYPGGLGQQLEEPFTVAQYETIMAELAAIRKELAAAKVRDEDWMKPTTVRVRELSESLNDGGTIDKDRLEPTARRVRELWEHAGLDE